MTLDEPSNGTSAASRTVHMFPSLAVTYDAASTTEPRDLHAEVRKLLRATGKPMQPADIQDELGEPREPLGVIAAALRAIGARETSDGWALMSTEDAEKLVARRATILAELHGWQDPVAATHLCAEGEDHDDPVTVLDDLIAADLVEQSGGESPRYLLTDSASETIIRLGAEDLARSTLPALAEAAEDRTAFERDATERFESERKAKLEAQGERDRLCTWLREKGQDPGDILHPAEPVVPGPKRDVFLWTKVVPVDDAVELEIAREERKLRAELALSQAALEAESGRHKGVKDRVNGRLKELEQAIIDRTFHRAVEAYKVPMWEQGETLIIKASDGSTILERESIAKGAQRTIPGTDTTPVAKVEPTTDAAAQAADAAADDQAKRAAEVRGKGPKGELTPERARTEAIAMFTEAGAAGLTGDLTKLLARRVAGTTRGKIAESIVSLASNALTALEDDGTLVQRGEAVVLATSADAAVDSGATEGDEAAE